VNQPDLLTIILLGLVEGLTEYLPVSSTGHLILAGELLGFSGQAGATFEIAIQSGAILAVLVAYWQRFAGVARGLVSGDAAARAFLRNVALGFLPAAVMGVLFIKAVEALLEQPEIVAVSLIVGGIVILWMERRMQAAHVAGVEQLPTGTALKIGLGQCLAMVPGVSRSGATIMAALWLGVDRRTAAEYSFFLGVPTIAGATALMLWKNRDALDASNLAAIGIGFAVSFVVALAVVKGFVALVSRFGFAPFAWYRIVAGTGALVWLMAR
jgi:undecaprenyl-diphosphatase